MKQFFQFLMVIESEVGNKNTKVMKEKKKKTQPPDLKEYGSCHN